jgi:predicted aspartyl protease
VRVRTARCPARAGRQGGRTLISKHRARRWASLILLLAGLAGCGISVQQPTTFGVSCAGSSTAVPDAAARAIPAHVVHTATATLALIPVCLSGQGPYPFILDTGAAHSLVDRSLADRLHLAVTGEKAHATGVACTAMAEQVQVANWSVGQVALRAQTLTSLSLNGSPGGPGIAGLLGSDVWSRFGRFRLDYRAGRLTLPGPEQAVAPTVVPDPAIGAVPMKVVHLDKETLALVPVSFDGHDPMMFVLDTGSSTSVVDRAVAQRLSLPPIGQAQHVTGVSCGTTTQPVHVASWRVGAVPLPAQNLDGIALAIPGLNGLLGSDVLYRFGTITVDYAAGRLMLEGAVS